MEAMAAGVAPKATGRPTANVAAVWRFYTTSTYRSGDLPAIAARECLQNSRDAVVAAIKAQQIGRGEGRFEVAWDEAERTLTFADNGIGMSADDVLNRFLSLGSSGKAGAASSGEAAGGFGVAKAVILGTSGSFRWELRTRDNRVVSHGEDRDIEIFQLDPPVQGTVLRLFDVPEKYVRYFSYARSQWEGVNERLKLVLGACDLDDVELRLNGEVVPRLFDRRRGSRLADSAPWAPGTTARIRGHRRPHGDRSGGYWVRLNGLFQFQEPSRRGDLPTDIVIDLSTTVRPGAEDYPLNAARDAIQGPARAKWDALVATVERENESAGIADEDEIFSPEVLGDDGEAAGALAELAAEAFDDPAFRRALSEASGGLLDLMAVEGPRTEEAPSSAAPASAVATVVSAAGGGEAGTPEVIRRFLIDADTRRQAASPDKEVPALLNEAVTSQLKKAERSGKLDDMGRRIVQFAITRAMEAAQEPGGGGLGQLITLPRVYAALDALAPPPPPEAGKVRRRRGPTNPFGALAGLRISKRHYDRQAARRFKRSWKKWLPHLTVWDAALRMIAAEASVRRRFKPGFILNDEYTGMAEARRGHVPVIYLHPDRLAEVMKAHRERPMAVAGFLHGVACHELTHLDGRMGQGHNEAFVTSREQLGRDTAHLLPAIAVLVQKVLKVGDRPSVEVQTIQKLERQIARLKEKAKTDRQARGQLARAQVALERCQASLDAAATLSAEVRAQSTGRCACQETAPDSALPSATSGQWPEVSLRQALLAWNPNLVVYAIAGQLLRTPPPGLTRGYIEAFIQRNEEALVGVVAGQMGWKHGS